MRSIVRHRPRTFRLISVLFAGVLVVVGAAGLVASACGGSNDEAVAAVERLLQVGQSPDTTTQVLLGKLPPGLPDGLPEYPGSKLIGSTVTTSSSLQGLGVLRESNDPVDQIYAFYEQALSVLPWEVQLSTFPGKVAGVQFSNQDYPSMRGAVVIQPSSSDDAKSMIFLSVQSVSGTATAEPFQLDVSKPLPLNWPQQIPVYTDATITDTGWGTTATTYEWQITFLAQAAPKDIIEFYRTQLTALGFTVADETPQGQESAISFQIAKPPETWSGAVTVQAFAQDPTYAQATVQVSIAPGGTPQSSGTPAP